MTLPNIPMEALLADISTLVAIPSVRAAAPEGCEQTMPFGPEVNRAIEATCEIGRRMGFEAQNLGYGALIVWPCGKENAERLTMAAHLDVVAVGSDWATDPFTATEIDGNLWGRGTLDNKGPGLAALHGIYALKQAGYTPNVDIHFFFGGNEESGMDDIKYYVRDFGIPSAALVPDDGFIVNSTVGVLFCELYHDHVQRTGPVRVLSAEGGKVINRVPAEATFTLDLGDSDVDPLPALQSQSTFAGCEREGSRLTVRFTGTEAFGGTPEKGVNAVLTGARAVQALLHQTGSSDSVIDFLADYFAGDFHCRDMGLFCEDTNYGAITSNVGILKYHDGEVSHTFDTRIPPLFQTNDILEKFEAFCAAHGVRVKTTKNIPSTYTPADSEYCQTIAGAFEAITGIRPKFYTSGGRTYAVELGSRALAYGPVGTAPTGHCHGNDEFISLKALQDLAGIYYETIRRLYC